MKAKMHVTLLALLLALAAGPARAQEGARNGAAVGWGLGPIGTRSQAFSCEPEDALAVGLVADFRMGAHTTPRLAPQLAVKGAWMAGGDTGMIFGVFGLQCTYYVRETAPSFYVSGLAGAAKSRVTSTGSDVGLAGGVAVGYEWRAHLAIELEVLAGVPDSGGRSSDEDKMLMIALKIELPQYRS
jgi:hypothetical protein